MDLTIKVNKYKQAGVREYWIIDPDDEQVVVYRLDEDALPHICEHRGFVPLQISEGRCGIDFTGIWDEIETLKQWKPEGL